MKRLTAFALALLLAFTLGGCGCAPSNAPSGTTASSGTSTSSGTSSSGTSSSSVSDTPTSNAQRTVTVWAWDPAFNIAALERARDIYEATHTDVTVDIVEYSQDDIIQKINTSLGAGTAQGLPNITLIEDYRAQSFLTAYPGAFADLTAAVDISRFADYKAAFAVADGVTYGVPFDTGATALFYRSDILAELGYEADDLKGITWDDYLEIGAALQEAHPELYMLTLDPDDLGLVRIVMQSCGAWYVAEDGVTPNFTDNPALREAILLFAELLDKGYAKPTSDWSQFIGGFNSGEAVTVVTGCWILPSIMAEEGQSGLWGVAPTPRVADIPDSVNASNLGGSSFYVFDEVENRDDAIDFLAATFGSSGDLYEKLLGEIGAIGTHASLGDSAKLDEELDFFGGQRVYGEFWETLGQIPAVNYGGSTYAYEDILKTVLQQVRNGGDIDEALAAAQAQAEAQVVE